MDKPAGLRALRNLDYTMLLCEDIASMRDFYVDTLGLKVHREIPDRYLELHMGATTLALRLRGRTYDGPSPDRSCASVQLAFRVPPGDVDIAARQLIDRGIELLEPVQNFADFGHRVLFVADPEQNVIEIFAEI